MNLSCAILHTDAQTARILEEYAGKTPFLTLCGTYTHTTDALKDYYERKVDVYFIGLEKSTEDDLSGLEFARLLSQPTRCIFIAHDGSYASECFRLDALDYLEGDIKFPIFFQATHKALRWFSLQKTGLPQNTPKANEHKEKKRFVRHHIHKSRKPAHSLKVRPHLLHRSLGRLRENLLLG